MYKIIRCIVACVNSNGEPDLYFVKVKATLDQYENGFHYQTARAAAEDEGYEAVLAYDENDSAGFAMLSLFEWDTASTVSVSEIPA